MYDTIIEERALLVLVVLKVNLIKRKLNWPIEELMAEFKNLVLSTGIKVEDTIVVKIDRPSSAFYIGKGKLEEIVRIVQEKRINVVVFNNNLTYTQQGNLEDMLGVKTIDRTQLILDVFARHAHTQEGSLQVELAQLKYMLPRLKGKGIFLSRLGGGIGTRGPGEKKLEIDRRRITDRISRLEKEIEEIRSQREIIHKHRIKNNVKVCSLVGYTNAGKTTLLNTLANESLKTEDSMFTTLDTVSRKVFVSANQEVLISDTVGFIYDLPKNLMVAFRATLEELDYSDILLHIVDASNKNYLLLINSVEEILRDLKLDEKEKIMVFNKIDKISQEDLTYLQIKYPDGVFISALNRIGIDRLFKVIASKLFALNYWIVEIPFDKMSLLDYLYQHTEVKEKKYFEDKIILKVQCPEDKLNILNRFKISYKNFTENDN